MNMSPQNSFEESHSLSIIKLMALRELNALRALRVNLVIEDEKSNGSDKKIALEKTTGVI